MVTSLLYCDTLFFLQGLVCMHVLMFNDMNMCCVTPSFDQALDWHYQVCVYIRTHRRAFNSTAWTSLDTFNLLKVNLANNSPSGNVYSLQQTVRKAEKFHFCVYEQTALLTNLHC